MATYYKYAERNADSQVNWAEVGQDVTDMLKAETKIREEKKGAIQKAFQDDMENLSNAPQGKWQDGNDTVNNFAHDMMGQKLMDKRLLESGQMKPRDYTLRSNNYSSQTNSLFELQTLLQNERQNTIDLYQKGEIQALNISNQADVEAYKNFKNSKVIISPYDANISMGLYEDQVIDGKTVRVLKKSTPVNVLMGQIVQKVPTLQIEEIMNKWVPTVGKQTDYIYQIATNSKAGSVVELMGVGALDNLEKEHPELKGKLGDYKKVIDDFNLSLTQQIQAWLPTPYQVGSVLTENLGGKYNADSYIWDENIARADKTKILKKVDPLTGMVTLDEDAPHYKEQKKEAEDWIRTSLLNKFDQQRNIKVTSTTPYAPNVPEYIYNAGKDDKKAVDMMQNIGAIYASDDAGIGKSLTALRDVNPNVKSMVRDDKGLTVTLIGPDKRLQTRTLPFYGTDGKLLTQEEFIISAAPLLTGNADAASAIKKGGLIKGGKFNAAGKGTALVVEGAPEPEKVKVKVTLDVFTAKSQDAEKQLKSLLKAYPGFIVEDKGGITGNKILITAPNGDKYPFETDKSTSTAEKNVEGLQQFLDRNITTVPAGGTPAANPQGVGAKYGG
jgi:hypothetical protein